MNIDLSAELADAHAEANMARVLAAESAGREAEAENRLAELRHKTRQTELERDVYRELLRRARRSRTMRLAAWLARFAPTRLSQPQPIWLDESRTESYVKRHVSTELGTKPARETAALPVRAVPLGSGRKADSVRVGLSSIPSRADGLLRVVDSLYDQVDEIFIYLNNYPQAPRQLANDTRIKAFTGPDLGDRGKFYFAQGFLGYYFSADDDIAYPPSYVEHLVDGIERYHRKAIVGLHGSIIADDFSSYYDPAHRRVLSFDRRVAHDQFVHILGTGCSAFHSETISIGMDDFQLPNMADVFLALIAQRQGIPSVVLAHPKGWVPALELGDSSSIYHDSRRGTKSGLDVGLEASRRVAAQAPWDLHRIEPAFIRPSIRVGVLTGTRHIERPFLVSPQILRDMLGPYGVHVQQFMAQDNIPNEWVDFRAHLTIVQMAQLERGSARIDRIIEYCNGAPVLIDVAGLSGSQAIGAARDWIETTRSRHGPHIRLLVDQMSNADIGTSDDAVIGLPRPFRIQARLRAQLPTSHGIVVGDLGRLLEARESRFPIVDWLDALRAAVPSAPLYATGNPKSSAGDELGLEIIKRRGATGLAKLAGVRLVATPLGFVPNDNLPIDSIAAGVPVIYDDKDQGLSAYIGAGGIGISSLEELRAAASLLYQDPLSWRLHSRAGAGRVGMLDHRANRDVYFRTFKRLITRV
jgi:hypothetical protein